MTAFTSDAVHPHYDPVLIVRNADLIAQRSREWGPSDWEGAHISPLAEHVKIVSLRKDLKRGCPSVSPSLSGTDIVANIVVKKMVDIHGITDDIIGLVVRSSQASCSRALVERSFSKQEDYVILDCLRRIAKYNPKGFFPALASYSKEKFLNIYQEAVLGPDGFGESARYGILRDLLSAPFLSDQDKEEFLVMITSFPKNLSFSFSEKIFMLYQSKMTLKMVKGLFDNSSFENLEEGCISSLSRMVHISLNNANIGHGILHVFIPHISLLEKIFILSGLFKERGTNRSSLFSSKDPSNFSYESENEKAILTLLSSCSHEEQSMYMKHSLAIGDFGSATFLLESGLAPNLSASILEGLRSFLSSKSPILGASFSKALLREGITSDSSSENEEKIKKM